MTIGAMTTYTQPGRLSQLYPTKSLLSRADDSQAEAKMGSLVFRL
jgi:hypothetical protein